MLLLHVIDVDMAGSGLLLQSPTHNILIDLAYREGTTKLENYLHNKGVVNIDLLVITHPHRDHMAGQGAGGLQRFTSNFNVSEVWSNGIPYPVWYDDVTVSPYGADAIVDYESYLNHIYPDGHTVMGENDYPGIQGIGTPIIPYHEPREGDVYSYGDIIIRVLNPQKPQKQSNTNASSIVMQVEYHGKKIMLAGDSIYSSENDILAKYTSAQLKSDILYLGHHGIVGSTSATWYNAINPEYVTVQRRDPPLASSIIDLIAQNGATLCDPYGSEEFYNPDPTNFENYVFVINSEGIEIVPDIEKTLTHVPMGLYVNGDLQACYMKQSGEWRACDVFRTVLR